MLNCKLLIQKIFLLPLVTEVVKDDSTQDESKKEATESEEGQTSSVDSPKGRKKSLAEKAGGAMQAMSGFFGWGSGSPTTSNVEEKEEESKEATR